MKSFLFPALLSLFVIGCKKNVTRPVPAPHPAMLYKDLADSSIIFGKLASFDLNNDGEMDVLFSTQLVGDPVEQKDKKQWFITTSFNTSLPVKTGEQIPRLSYADAIPINNFPGYNWYNASSIVLAQKTISVSLPPYWEGDWKDASHHYIPIQVKKQDDLYNGWVEISFSTNNEQLILHKTAMCKEANKTVLAGK